MHTLPLNRIAQLARIFADAGRKSGDPTAGFEVRRLDRVADRAEEMVAAGHESVDVELCSGPAFFERISAAMQVLSAGHGKSPAP